MTMNTSTLETLIDKDKINDLLHKYLDGLDTRNWEQVASVFTRPFHLQAVMLDVDRELQPEDYLGLGPQRFLPGFDFTAHLCSNTSITIDGSEAHLKTKLLACHHTEPDDAINSHQLSAPAGSYYCNMHMPWEGWLTRQDDGSWLIRKFRMSVSAVEGDTTAFEIARTRTGG